MEHDRAEPAGCKKPGPVWSMLMAAGLAIAILCTGTLAGHSLRKKSGEVLVRQVLLQQTPPQGAQSVRQEKAIAFFKEYLLAFADAAIRFDTVPKFDMNVVSAISAAIPQDITVVGAAFSGYALLLDCRYSDADSPRHFQAALQASGQFAQVTLGQPHNTAEGTLALTVSCLPAVQQGQLAFDFPPGPVPDGSPR